MKEDCLTEKLNFDSTCIFTTKGLNGCMKDARQVVNLWFNKDIATFGRRDWK